MVVGRRPDGTREYSPVEVATEGGALNVTIGERRHRITFHGRLSGIVINGDFDGMPYCAQIERVGLEWRILHNGVVVAYRVISPLAAKLLAGSGVTTFWTKAGAGDMDTANRRR